MRCVLAALALAALAGSAQASAWLVAPDGWHADAARGKDIADEAGQVSHFGGAAAVASAQSYEPAAPGVVLDVVMVSAAKPADLAAAARAEVDALHDTVKRAALAGSGVGEDRWENAVDAAGTSIEARLAWHDAGAGTKESDRLVIVSDGATIVALTGQCIAASDAPPALVAQCEAALGTLDPGVAPTKRVALALAPEGSGAVAPAVPGAPQLVAPAHTPLAPIPVPPPARPRADARPVVIGIALVIMAVVFWWNRRRRERYAADKESSQG